MKFGLVLICCAFLVLGAQGRKSRRRSTTTELPMRSSYYDHPTTDRYPTRPPVMGAKGRKSRRRTTTTELPVKFRPYTTTALSYTDPPAVMGAKGRKSRRRTTTTELPMKFLPYTTTARSYIDPDAGIRYSVAQVKPQPCPDEFQLRDYNGNCREMYRTINNIRTNPN